MSQLEEPKTEQDGGTKQRLVLCIRILFTRLILSNVFSCTLHDRLMAASLHHEHLVRINDPANFTGEWLTREQLWAGLRHTVEAPQVLDDSIDSAFVRENGPGILAREIRRGSVSMRDEVRLVPNESLQICADASGAFAGSTLTIRIEEPAPEILFVRFIYEICGLPEVREEEEDTARCSAYKHSDFDRVRAARQYAARGGYFQ